jgi:membrane protease YdiL (CAAX protease family)
MKTSIKTDQPTPVSSNLQVWMRQHPLFSFFFLAYTISWLLSIPDILAEWGVLPKSLFVIFFTIKSFGPALAAYIMVRIMNGNEGWQALRRSMTQWRAGWEWYVFILLGIPAVFTLGILVLPGALASFQGLPPHLLITYLILPGALASFQGLPPHFLITYLISFILIFFGGGPLGEEPGWRGFALPRLQTRYGAFRATLLLGILWTFWHLPDFLTSAQHGGPAAGLKPFITNLPLFTLMVVALAFIFTWVFNHTQGSVFMALLLHASINTFGILQSPAIFSAPIVTNTDLPFMLPTVTLAILIIILTGGRLGYHPEQGQVQN